MAIITLSRNNIFTIYIRHFKFRMQVYFSVDLKPIIPPHTNTNANKVPILVKASTTSRFKNKAGIATNTTRKYG